MLLSKLSIGLCVWLAVLAAGQGSNAQSADPGPPPDAAAPVPTLDQAREFFVSMARQYGASEYQSRRTTHRQAIDLEIEDNRVLVHKITTIIDDNTHEKPFIIKTDYSFLLSEMKTSVHPSHTTEGTTYPPSIAFFARLKNAFLKENPQDRKANRKKLTL